MDNTLYVSDLDGTLLNSDQQISKYTADTINDLVARGMLFSYATARSFVTASKLTGAITAEIPVILYNGAFVLDSLTGKILLANYFSSNQFDEIFHLLAQNDVYPIVYSNSGKERFSYLFKMVSRGMQTFLDSRRGDVREDPVEHLDDLRRENVFYFTCIDEAAKLFPIYQRLRDSYSCVYQKDLYSGEQWLEIMPPQVNKANAILRLKKLLHCERLVSFGDGENDIPMFQISDECYAVAQAVPELKAAATGVIGGNDEDGVAEWLKANAGVARW